MYDGGSCFRLKKWFPNDGAPSPKIVGNKINNEHFFLRDSCCVPRPWDFSSGIVAVSFFSELVLLGDVLSFHIEKPKTKKWCTFIVARDKMQPEEASHCLLRDDLLLP